MQTTRGVHFLMYLLLAAAYVTLTTCQQPFGLRVNIHDPEGTWVVPASGRSPADGATPSDTTPLLDWGDVPGAASYEVQFGTSAAGLDAATPVAASSSQYQIPSALAYSTWYWRVRAVNHDGVPAVWSATWSFVAGTAGKALTSFGIVSAAASGTIDESAHTVAVAVPYGTNVTALVATFTTTGSQVKVGSAVQVSGTTANNFTSPVMYTVVAADASTQNYVVTVTVSPPSAKALTSFGIVSPAASGTIDESAHTVAVTVPSGTNVTALVATFTTTGAQVKVGSTVQTSGVTPNDFTSPVTYSVVAADATTQNYVVTVSVGVAAKWDQAEWDQALWGN